MIETTVKISGRTDKGHYKAWINGKEELLIISQYAKHPIEDADPGDLAHVWINTKEGKTGETVHFLDGLMRMNNEDVPFDVGPGGDDSTVVYNDPTPIRPEPQEPADPTPKPSSLLSVRDESIVTQVAIKAAAEITVAEIAAGLLDTPDAISKRVYQLTRHLVACHHQVLDD